MELIEVDGHRFNDTPIDTAAVEAGAWDEPRYGRGDRLGSYHEVTPERTARALASLDPAVRVASASLGESLFVGYPGWGSRGYDQRLSVSGFDPGPDFSGEVARATPRGLNRAVTLEERVRTSYNIGTKVNGLAHAAVGEVAYGGRRLSTLLTGTGLADLDTTTWGPPLVTRGLLVDVLGAVLADGRDAALDELDGEVFLREDYRITTADLAASWARQGLPEPEPGDAILLRTGWRALLRHDPRRYISHTPGVWLRETRWLAHHRPALVGTDSWCWGCVGPTSDDGTIDTGQIASCHQELLVHHGIRIAESLNLQPLVEAGIDRFVFVHNPLGAAGAVSSSAPPLALFQAS